MGGKWVAIKKCARKAGLGRLFALHKPKHSHAQSTKNTTTETASRPLQRPETYVPSGAPWATDATHDDDDDDDKLFLRDAAGRIQTRFMHKTDSAEDLDKSDAPKLIRLNNGEKQDVAILLGEELQEKLQNAVQEDRAVKRTEEEAVKRLTRLDQDLAAVKLDLEDLDDEVAELEESGEAHSQAMIDQLSNSRELLQRRAEKISTDRLKCSQALDARYRSQGHNCHEVLCAFGKLFVDAGLMPPEDGVTTGAAESEAEVGCPAQDIASTASVRGPLLGRYDADMGPSIGGSSLEHTASGLLRRKSAMMDLRASELSVDNVMQDHQVSIAEAQRLVRAYEAEQMRLRAMEDAFDGREERFDREADERDRQVLAGEEVESKIAFDMRQLQETRRMGQRLQEAEDALDAAKAAVFAAGIQLQDSDIESGFVDDVNDGYRISAEQRVAASVDPKWIFVWMGSVSDLSGADEVVMPELDATEFEGMETEAPEVDDWDAQSIGVSESGSMVAAGPYRRRIDKWRSACEAINIAEPV